MALHDALLGAALLGSLLYILIRRQPDPDVLAAVIGQLLVAIGA